MAWADGGDLVGAFGVCVRVPEVVEGAVAALAEEGIGAVRWVVEDLDAGRGFWLWGRNCSV